MKLAPLEEQIVKRGNEVEAMTQTRGFKYLSDFLNENEDTLKEQISLFSALNEIPELRGKLKIIREIKGKIKEWIEDKNKILDNKEL